MNFTIYLTDRNRATVRQTGREGEVFWSEMEFVHWYMIRVLSDFLSLPCSCRILSRRFISTGNSWPGFLLRTMR